MLIWEAVIHIHNYSFITQNDRTHLSTMLLQHILFFVLWVPTWFISQTSFYIDLKHN